MIGNRSSATPVKKAGEAAPEGRSAAEQSAPRTCGRGDAVPSLQGFEAEGFARIRGDSSTFIMTTFPPPPAHREPRGHGRNERIAASAGRPAVASRRLGPKC